MPPRVEFLGAHAAKRPHKLFVMRRDSPRLLEHLVKEPAAFIRGEGVVDRFRFDHGAHFQSQRIGADSRYRLKTQGFAGFANMADPWSNLLAGQTKSRASNEARCFEEIDALPYLAFTTQPDLTATLPA
jgi:hypothetical protein